MQPNDTMLKALKWKHALSTTLKSQPVQEQKEQKKSKSGTGFRYTRQMDRFSSILIMEVNYFKPRSDLFFWALYLFFMPKPNQAN